MTDLNTTETAIETLPELLTYLDSRRAKVWGYIGKLEALHAEGVPVEVFDAEAVPFRKVFGELWTTIGRFYLTEWAKETDQYYVLEIAQSMQYVINLIRANVKHHELRSIRTHMGYLEELISDLKQYAAEQGLDLRNGPAK